MPQTLHSITHAIPLTPQTDPNKFPRGDYQPYPRMMVRVSNDPKLDGKPFYDVTGRIPVVVQNEDEEADFRAAHPGEVRDNVPNAADLQDELATLRAENARLKALTETQATTAPSKVAGGVASLVRPGEDKPQVDDDGAPAQPPRPAAREASRRTPPRKLD